MLGNPFLLDIRTVIFNLARLAFHFATRVIQDLSFSLSILYLHWTLEPRFLLPMRLHEYLKHCLGCYVACNSLHSTVSLFSCPS